MGRKRVYPIAEGDCFRPERKFWFKVKQYAVWQTLSLFLNHKRLLRIVLLGDYNKDQALPITADFTHLTAGFLCDLVPVGIWTDRFEELFPEQKVVIDFLRRWEERKREIDSA